MGTCGIRTNGLNRRHRCCTSQEPSEGQVSEQEISMNSLVRELKDFLCTCERWRSGTYIVMNGESKSLQSRDLSLLGGLGTQGFQDFRVPFHMREIQANNGFYFACYVRYFHVQIFVGTKTGHAGSVDLSSPSGPQLVQWFPVGLQRCPSSFIMGSSRLVSST